MPEPAEMAEPEREPGLAGTVVRGVGLAGGGYILSQALHLGFYVALARLATPTDFGEFAAGSAIVGVGLLVSESGIMSALIQRRDRIEEAAATTVLATFAGGLALALVALAVSPLLGDFFDSARVGAIAAAMSGVILLRPLTAAPDALLQRRFSFLRRVIIEPMTAVAFGVAAVIATASDMGAWGLVIGQYAAVVVEVCASWTLARWRPQLRLASFGMWRELVAYGRHLLAANIILRTAEQADVFWLGRFLGAAPLGQFRYAMRLASTPYWALVAGASYVLFPAFSRIAEEKERFEAAFIRSLRWMALAGFAAAFLMLALGEPLTIVLFGTVWRPAGYAVMAMGLYTAAGVLSSIASEALKAHGRPDLLTRMHTVTAVLSAGLMGVGIPIGLEAVAAAVSIGWSISAIYAMWLVATTIGFSGRAIWTEIRPPLIAGLALAGTILPLEQFVIRAADQPTGEAAALMIGEGILGAAIFLAVIRILRPSTWGELRRGLGKLARRRRSQPAAAE